MSKIVIYWSSTGNTESIANKIAGDLGVEAKALADTSVDEVKNYDVIVFGSPAMGAEELDEDETRPFFEELLPQIGDKKLALFGSYGWGGGEWLDSWEEEATNGGANVVAKLAVMGDADAVEADAYDAFIAALN